jgi:hypothetical protein
MINVENISSKLALMPDGALKQYAEMHKDDPYTFSLALSESNRRKQMRSQAPQVAPQPKVVDQELADMEMRKALPEDTGIARLPINMNMASGGIVAFNDGGMAHYARGGDAGSDPKLAYRQYALTQAEKFNLDPTLVDSIFKIESNYDADAQSPTGPQGIGQLTKATGKAYGVNPEDRKDPYKNIDASIAYIADLNKKYAGDPSKIAVAYNQGETVLNKHLRANKGELNASVLPAEAQGYLKKLQKLAFNLAPGSTAQAEEVPSQTQPIQQPTPQEADRSVTGQFSRIGQGLAGIGRRVGDVVAPESSDYAPGTRNFFERAADQLGVGEETQRNFSNTLNALPGVGTLRAPAMVGKLSATAQAAREAEIAAAAQKAAAAQAKVANLRLPSSQPAQGIEQLARPAAAPPVAPRTTYPLSPEAVEMNQKMQAAKQAQALRNLEADRAAAEAANRGVTTAQDAAKTSEAMEMANAARVANNANRITQPANKVLDAARAVQAARVGPMDSFSGPGAVDDETQRLASRYPIPSSANNNDRTPRDPASYKPEEKKQIIAAAKDAVPETKETEGWSGNDWLQFGLSLMAGQSPHALQNIGTAGLNVVASRAEKQKEQNRLDAEKAISLNKQEKLSMIKELMAEDPKLTFSKAVEKLTKLTEPPSRMAGVDARLEKISSDDLKTFETTKNKIVESYKLYEGLTSPTARTKIAERDKQLKELYGRYKIPLPENAQPATGWGQATKQ